MAKLKVTQLKSLIGRKKNHRLSVKGLGLRGIGDSKVVEDTPSVRGMINQVEYMVSVEEVKIMDKLALNNINDNPSRKEKKGWKRYRIWCRENSRSRTIRVRNLVLEVT